MYFFPIENVYFAEKKSELKFEKNSILIFPFDFNIFRCFKYWIVKLKIQKTTKLMCWVLKLFLFFACIPEVFKLSGFLHISVTLSFFLFPLKCRQIWLNKSFTLLCEYHVQISQLIKIVSIVFGLQGGPLKTKHHKTSFMHFKGSYSTAFYC